MADCSRTLGLLLGQLRLVEGGGAERVGDSGCMWNPVLQGGHPVRRDLVLSGEILRCLISHYRMEQITEFRSTNGYVFDPDFDLSPNVYCRPAPPPTLLL